MSGGKISVYGSFIRNAFLNMLAYRARYYTGILTYLLFVSVYYFIWQATYEGKGEGALINGYTFAQMVTYISIGWLSRSLYFSNIDDQIDDLVRSGQISFYLLRPVDFQGMLMANAVGESLFRLLLFSVPIGVTIFSVFPIMPPASGGDFLWFCFSTLMAFVILAQINFLVGLLAFSFKSIDGVMRAKYFIVQLLSGLLLPLSFFPLWIERPLEWLPFKNIAHTPLQFYLGKVTQAQLPLVLAHQLIWALLLFIWGRMLWQRALAKLTLQGG